MPEGDTAHLTARRLHDAFAGKVLVQCDLRVPQAATVKLAGQHVQEVLARGKHLLLRTDAELTLYSHLGMDGSWRLLAPRERWPAPAHWVRAVVATSGRQALGLRLARCRVLPTAQEHTLVGHLGPDVLGPDWDVHEAVRRLLLEKDRPIGEALLDQHCMAGPGNVYKCEVMFLRGLDPWQRVGDVADLEEVIALLARLMEANRNTGRRVTTGDQRPGRSYWVTHRGGRPCRRCATTIKVAPQGQAPEARLTYWCPSCQPSTGSHY